MPFMKTMQIQLPQSSTLKTLMTTFKQEGTAWESDLMLRWHTSFKVYQAESNNLDSLLLTS